MLSAVLGVLVGLALLLFLTLLVLLALAAAQYVGMRRLP